MCPVYYFTCTVLDPVLSIPTVAVSPDFISHAPSVSGQLRTSSLSCHISVPHLHAVVRCTFVFPVSRSPLAPSVLHLPTLLHQLLCSTIGLALFPRHSLIVRILPRPLHPLGCSPTHPTCHDRRKHVYLEKDSLKLRKPCCASLSFPYRCKVLHNWGLGTFLKPLNSAPHTCTNSSVKIERCPQSTTLSEGT